MYVVEEVECLELTVESLWVRIKGQINKADVTVRVYFRSPRQDDDTNKLFFEELKMLSSQLPLCLWGTSDCQKSTVRITQVVQSRPEDSLKSPDHNFMAQFLKEQNRKDTLLVLLLLNREDFVSKVGICGWFGHCSHEAIEC